MSPDQGVRGVVSPEAAFLGSQMAVFSVFSQGVPFVHDYVLPFSSCKNINQIGLGPIYNDLI